MDRLEFIRGKVDTLIETIHDKDTRKFAYLHLYGTSQFATMLAIHKKMDVELCAISAMLHDVSLYVSNSGHPHHAHDSAIIANTILQDSSLFEEDEILKIVHAIEAHSDKQKTQDGIYAEVLKDADVLAHYLYNVNIPIPDKDKVRLFYLLEFIKEDTKKQPQR